MSAKFDSYQKRRLQSSYLSVVISIALVLFIVGVLGLVLLKSTSVANRVKEKVAITLFIKDKVTQIKLAETISVLSKTKIGKNVSDNHVSSIMMSYELIKELKVKI